MTWNNPHPVCFGNRIEVISKIFRSWYCKSRLISLSQFQPAAVLSVISVSPLCPDACRELLTDKSYNLTLGDHFAKHRHGLQSGAVPSTVAKLELTLVYSELGSTTYRIHHLHTALTDLNLEHRHKHTSHTDKILLNPSCIDVTNLNP